MFSGMDDFESLLAGAHAMVCFRNSLIFTDVQLPCISLLYIAIDLLQTDISMFSYINIVA